ncbi:MAG: hypothetical protein C4341_06605 [Armatimonadota bacterium]
MTFLCAVAVVLGAIGRGGDALPRISDASPPSPPAGWIKTEYRKHGFECFVPGYTQEHVDDPTIVGAGTSYVCVTPKSIYVAWVSMDWDGAPLTEPDLASHIKTMGSFRLQGPQLCLAVTTEAEGLRSYVREG